MRFESLRNMAIAEFDSAGLTDESALKNQSGLLTNKLGDH